MLMQGITGLKFTKLGGRGIDSNLFIVLEVGLKSDRELHTCIDIGLWVIYILIEIDGTLSLIIASRSLHTTHIELLSK